MGAVVGVVVVGVVSEHTTVLMPTFRVCWFDGELVEMRQAEGLCQLAEELLDEWVDDPEFCPLEVFDWLDAQGISWSAPDGGIGARTAAAAAVRRALREYAVAVRLFLIACGGCLSVEEL